ncbi:hypothetical protein ABPG74_017520 [Tetrahymena malaccensis]
MSSVVVENSANLHYVQDLLVKSVELSKKLYEKTGFKNEFLESNAQKINAASSQFAQLLDGSIDATVVKVQSIAEKTNKTKQQLLERTNKTKKELIEKTMNLTVVKKTEDLGNTLLTELEQQVALLTKSINNKLALPESEGESSSANKDEKLALTERSTRLLLTLNNLGKQIAEHYLNQVKSLTIVKSAQQKYALVDLKAQEARANLESFFEVLLTTVITNNIINPLFNSLNVKYTQSKDQVTVVVENIKKVDVQNLLTQAKDSYESLKQATITFVKGDKLTFTFAREFFKTSIESIQKEITQLLTDVSALRARFQVEVLNLYQLSLEEFKQRRSAKLGKKAIAPSAEEQVNSSSTASPVESKNEEEEAQN